MKRAYSMEAPALAGYLHRQMSALLPDEPPTPLEEIRSVVEQADERVFECFAGVRKKYFNEDGVVRFDHLHSDQYCMYLYMLANHVFQRGGDLRIATKLYYLNKILHSVDIYYTTMLPESFLFVHPLGTILGRATFEGFFVAYQGCTVGCLNSGIFPRFGRNTVLYAGASVLGECRIGSDVCVGPGVSVIDTDIPDDVIVLGSHPDYELRKNGKPLSARPPFWYGR